MKLLQQLIYFTAKNFTYPGRLVAGARRPVRFAGGDGAIDTPVYRGERIPSGARIEGPAVIEESTTTIVLDPGAVATAAPAHYRIDLEELP